MSQKIVINACHGGFSLSENAVARYTKLTGVEVGWGGRNIARDDESLVRIVEQLGDGANGTYARLVVVTIPADVQWEIGEYDGLEWVAEKHRRWTGDEEEGC